MIRFHIDGEWKPWNRMKATFLEHAIASALTPSTRTPAATPVELRAASRRSWLGLTPTERALWLPRLRAWWPHRVGTLSTVRKLKEAGLVGDQLFER